MKSVCSQVNPQSSNYVDVAIPSIAHSRVFVLPHADNANRKSATEPSKSVNHNCCSRKQTVNQNKFSGMYQTESVSFKTRIHQIVKGKSRKRANTIAVLVAKDNSSDSEDLSKIVDRKKLKQEKQMQYGMKLIQFCRKTRQLSAKTEQDQKMKTNQKHHRVLSLTTENYNYIPSSKTVQSESLIEDFNKTNCYLFSRSKQKVMIVDSLDTRRVDEKSNKQQNRSQNFKTVFYKKYLKKYRDRYNMLKGKNELLKSVAL